MIMCCNQSFLTHLRNQPCFHVSRFEISELNVLEHTNGDLIKDFHLTLIVRYSSQVSVLGHTNVHLVLLNNIFIWPSLSEHCFLFGQICFQDIPEG